MVGPGLGFYNYHDFSIHILVINLVNSDSISLDLLCFCLLFHAFVIFHIHVLHLCSVSVAFASPVKQ